MLYIINVLRFARRAKSTTTFRCALQLPIEQVRLYKGVDWPELLMTLECGGVRAEFFKVYYQVLYFAEQHLAPDSLVKCRLIMRACIG